MLSGRYALPSVFAATPSISQEGQGTCASLAVCTSTGALITFSSTVAQYDIILVEVTGTLGGGGINTVCSVSDGFDTFNFVDGVVGAGAQSMGWFDANDSATHAGGILITTVCTSSATLLGVQAYDVSGLGDFVISGHATGSSTTASVTSFTPTAGETVFAGASWGNSIEGSAAGSSPFTNLQNQWVGYDTGNCNHVCILQGDVWNSSWISGATTAPIVCTPTAGSCGTFGEVYLIFAASSVTTTTTITTSDTFHTSSTTDSTTTSTTSDTTHQSSTSDTTTTSTVHDTSSGSSTSDTTTTSTVSDTFHTDNWVFCSSEDNAAFHPSCAISVSIGDVIVIVGTQNSGTNGVVTAGCSSTGTGDILSTMENLQLNSATAGSLNAIICQVVAGSTVSDTFKVTFTGAAAAAADIGAYDLGQAGAYSIGYNSNSGDSVSSVTTDIIGVSLGNTSSGLVTTYSGLDDINTNSGTQFNGVGGSSGVPSVSWSSSNFVWVNASVSPAPTTSSVTSATTSTIDSESTTTTTTTTTSTSTSTSTVTTTTTSSAVPVNPNDYPNVIYGLLVIFLMLAFVSAVLLRRAGYLGGSKGYIG